MESAVFLRWRRGDEWEQRGDLYRASWFSDYEDPENWYNHIWDSESDPGVYNGGWKNAQFDSLVRQALMETDTARRTALYSQADQVDGARTTRTSRSATTRSGRWSSRT